MLLLKDRPEFPFYATSTREAAYTQWPLCQRYVTDWHLLGTMDGLQCLAKVDPVPTPVNERGGFPFRQFILLHLPPAPTPEEVALENDIAGRLGRLPFNTSILALERLVGDIWHLSDMQQLRFRSVISNWTPFLSEILMVEARILALTPKAFQQPVQPPLEYEILGYLVPALLRNFRMSHGMYAAFYHEWHREDQLTFEALENWLEEACWTAWNTMDVHGEGVYFSGFFDENAFELARADKIRALCSLSYPTRAIVFTVEIGRRNFHESVVYTVVCCEWFKRKLEQMKDIPFESYVFDEKDDLLP